MKRSFQVLSIGIVIVKGIFKNNQFTLFFCFTFTPGTGIGISKHGVVFTVTPKMFYHYQNK